ncbi:MAG: hypothetical protein ACYTF1_02165 [Planctomycetota bacterium]|jgi:hypothetical protein
MCSSFRNINQYRISIFITLCTLVSNGCGSTTKSIDSKLTGDWQMTEGKSISMWKGAQPEIDIFSDEEGKFYARFNSGGSFDLSLIYTPAIGAHGLRNKGDRFLVRDKESNSVIGYIEVENSIYTQNSSELILHLYGDELRKAADSITFSAVLVQNGKVEYKHVIKVGDFTHEVKGILERKRLSE